MDAYADFCLAASPKDAINKNSLSLSLYVYIFIHNMYIYIYIYVYIYIYIYIRISSNGYEMERLLFELVVLPLGFKGSMVPVAPMGLGPNCGGQRPPPPLPRHPHGWEGEWGVEVI